MTWLTASIADSAINARPKLVCNTVPVKLKTGFMAAFRCNAIRFLILPPNYHAIAVTDYFVE